MLFRKENIIENIEDENDGLVKVSVFEPENEFDEPNCYCQNRGAAIDKKSNGLSNKYSDSNESSCDCKKEDKVEPITRYTDPNEDANVHYAPDIAEDIKKIRFTPAEIDNNIQHLDLINNNNVSEYLKHNENKQSSEQQVSNNEEESCKCKNKHKDYDEEFEIIGQALFTIIKKLDKIEKKLDIK